MVHFGVGVDVNVPEATLNTLMGVVVLSWLALPAAPLWAFVTGVTSATLFGAELERAAKALPPSTAASSPGATPATPSAAQA